MSIRTLIRILALSVAMVLASPLSWSTAGPLPLLGGLVLLALTLGYLVLAAGGGDLTRWQLRYHLPSGAAQEELGRLEHVLQFLSDRTGHFVLEACATGLVLEIPKAFDRYVEAQLPRALSEVKLSKEDDNGEGPSPGSFFVFVGQLRADVLRWATEDDNGHVRLHLHQGPHTTLIAQTDGTRPPGRWVRLPLPRLLQRLWYRLPLWDDLSTGIRPSTLLPLTDDVTVYSSRSRLHQLIPPDDYTPDPADDGGCRTLGQSTDGCPLTLSYDVHLFTVGAPAAFLAQQVLADLEAGWAVIVVSPHRSLLDWIARQTAGIPTHWLDPHNSQRSAHLAIVGAEERGTHSSRLEAAVPETLSFLAGLGVDVDLPAVGAFCQRLVRALAGAVQNSGQDLTFVDLYAISRNTRTLRAYLVEMQSLSGDDAQDLLAQLDDDAGYVQAVTILSAIRTALEPLGAGPLHSLCSPPFLNIGQLVRDRGLLLVPMTDTDFPRHDRLLSAMLDSILKRAVATEDELQLALHLHDPQLYRDDHGQRWIDFARQGSRLTLLLDVQDPRNHTRNRMGGDGAEVIFRCSESLASHIIDGWRLPASIADLTELPAGTAVARLPDMTVTLKVSDE